MKMAKSVPWSRLKPRRKYWLALPPPACCVMMRPGTVSRISPERRIGRSWISVAPTVPWVPESAIPIKVILPALHVDGGAHGAHSQRDAQRGRRPGGPDGDGNFFGFKTGIRYHKSIIARRESGNNEGAVRCPTVSFFVRCRRRFEPARSPRQSLRQKRPRQFPIAEADKPCLPWQPASSPAPPQERKRKRLAVVLRL